MWFLREADKGVAVKELWRKHGLEPSYYLWRSKYGGMDVSDARRLKSLEGEHASKEAAGRVDTREEVAREALRKRW